MARPLRIQYPGAWYHVMNRGGEKRILFRDNQDYQAFLTLLNESSEMWRIEIHAYCLMPNHYHLLVRTPLTNLPRAMRHINGVYTQRFNRRWKRDSQLFRGRYKAILIEEEAYLIEAVRYIHTNPVAAELAKAPESYRWSSYPHYLGRDGPEFLITKTILNYFGNTVNMSRRKLVEFTMEGVPEKLKSELGEPRWPAVLGTELFKRWVDHNFVPKPKSREVVYNDKAKTLTIKQVIDSVCAAGELSWGQIRRAVRGENAIWRKLAILALRRELGLSYVKISRAVGQIDPSQISRLIHKETEYLEKRHGWQRLAAELATRWLENRKSKVKT